ncbi:YoaK family protein [Sphingobacterium tabacisoli]|uniref:YoaK family protein n=1 Tax=Sphingobacterium tabacisoli TaxID=2044855 RepID=A0ABW5L0C7_9SPHI|nr:YoaK family protein [Sphingobacterium tabacisoli]
MLSFVAGLVNVCGVMQIQILTTNVTGHFAYFAENIVLNKYAVAITFILYVTAFLAGAFCSSLLIELFSRKSVVSSYVFPISIEIICLLFVAFFGDATVHPYVIASILLFAMGTQNALVSKISNSVVRTTHLTGLFTDLGIELSLLLFHKRNNQNIRKIKQNIYLKFVIILLFFFGSVLGGFLALQFHFKTLFVAVVCLILAMSYDYFKLSYVHLRRRLSH